MTPPFFDFPWKLYALPSSNDPPEAQALPSPSSPPRRPALPPDPPFPPRWPGTLPTVLLRPTLLVLAASSSLSV